MAPLRIAIARNCPSPPGGARTAPGDVQRPLFITPISTAKKPSYTCRQIHWILVPDRKKSCCTVDTEENSQIVIVESNRGSFGRAHIATSSLTPSRSNGSVVVKLRMRIVRCGCSVFFSPQSSSLRPPKGYFPYVKGWPRSCGYAI